MREVDADLVVSGARRFKNYTRFSRRRVLMEFSTGGGRQMYRVLLFALIILAALWAVADVDTRSQPEARLTATARG
jgi:hypothetical protein